MNGAAQQPHPTAPAKASLGPDGVGLDQVRAYLGELLAAGRSDEALEQVMALLARMATMHSEQQHRIAALLRQLYGRRSEKISPDQLDLALAHLAQSEQDADAAQPTEPTPAPPAPPPPSPEPASPPQRRPGRNELPVHLPRIRIEHNVEPALRPCPLCGVERTCMGHEVSEVLDFEPGRFVVHQMVREKLACRPCQEQVVVAPPAAKLVEGGMCGAGLMAQVLTAKYQDHCPLYRLRTIFARMGVALAESTLGSWVAAGATLLQPLAELIWQRAAACSLVGADDTGLRVLDADHDKGIKRGHLWAYLGYDDGGAPQWAAIRYTPDWSKQGPEEYLAEFAGTLQGDGYKGWLSVARGAPGRVTLAGCWAHARRKLVEALEAKALSAAVAVRWVQQLYLVEAKARRAGLDVAARWALRQAESVPVMAELRKWLDLHGDTVRPTSPLGQAIGYLTKQWAALQVFLSDGRVPIDNNLVENQMRPIGVGRKNWLFAGSDAGAERAAVIYTVLATCRLAGVEVWAYLRDVLPELARRAGAGSDVGDLLPYHWAQVRAVAAHDALAAPAA